jgi:UDP-glucose 4-epimerase
VHGTGAQTRSFTWVGDVVWALLALVAEPRSVGQVFNIGNGAEVSIHELAKMIVSMTDSDSDIRFTPHHEVFGHNFEDMSRRVPDISKIQRLVGFEPRVHLDEILERVIEYWMPESVTIASAVRGLIQQESAPLVVH